MSKRTREMGWLMYNAMQTRMRRMPRTRVDDHAVDLAWAFAISHHHLGSYEDWIAIAESELEIIAIEHDLAAQSTA